MIGVHFDEIAERHAQRDALIVRDQNIRWTYAELREFHRDEIAHYKVPRYFRFVDSFPMTVTGKIQKYILRERRRHSGCGRRKRPKRPRFKSALSPPNPPLEGQGFVRRTFQCHFTCTVIFFETNGGSNCICARSPKSSCRV